MCAAFHWCDKGLSVRRRHRHCGKKGQDVPVGVGQPSLRMDKIMVGGTG
jgi:hypothetical protein